MRHRADVIAGVLGLVGIALLGYESVEAFRRIVLGTVGTTLLFVGLGLIVVAGAIVLAGPPRPGGAADGTNDEAPQPADDDAAPLTPPR
jgi:hypothetical protein